MTKTQVTQENSAEAVSVDHPGWLDLVLATVVMGATGVMLIATGLWALTFEGSMSRDLTRALDGHTLTSAGVLLVTVGALLVLCVVGVLVGHAHPWLGLVSRLIAIVIGIAVAVSNVWLVTFYPGWAVTYAVLGSLIVYYLTHYEKALHSVWRWASLRVLREGLRPQHRGSRRPQRRSPRRTVAGHGRRLRLAGTASLLPQRGLRRLICDVE